MSRDSGAFAYIGWQVLRGALPLRDIWDHKPPGIHYLMALALALGGTRLETVLVLDLVTAILVLGAAYWALRQVAGATPAATAVLIVAAVSQAPSIREGGNFTESYAELPLFLAYGCAARLVTGRHAHPRALALAIGGLTALAVLFKPTSVGPVLALFATAALLRLAGLRANSPALRELAWCGIGLVLPLSLVGVISWAQGGLPALVETNLTYNRLYAPQISARLMVELARFVLGQPPFLLWAVLLFTLAAVKPNSPSRGRPSERNLQLLGLTALVIDLALLVGQGRFYGHYLLGAFPAFALVTAWLLNHVALRARESITHERVLRLIVTGVLLILILLIRADDISVPSASEAAFDLHVHTPDVVERVDRCSSSATVYVWGAESEIYFLSLRKAASRYAYLYPLQMPRYGNPARVAQLERDITSSMPCVIVDTSAINSMVPPLDPEARKRWHPSSAAGGAYSYAEFNPIYQLIEDQYHSTQSVGAFTLYCAQATGPCKP